MPIYRMNGTLVHLKLSGKAAKNPPAPCCARIAIDGVQRRCMGISTHLCDWPIEGGTCDAPVCDEHAHEVGPDRHHCPLHVRQGAEQDPR